MEVTFVSNSYELDLYQFNCIKYLIEGMPNVTIKVYVTGESKSNNLFTNTIIKIVDSRFLSLNEDPFSKINLNEKKAEYGYSILTDHENLTISDWLVFLNPELKTDRYREKTKYGFLRFNDTLQYFYAQSVCKQLYTRIELECKTLQSNIWVEVEKMDLKTEIGIYNNRDKALLNLCLMLPKFLKKPFNKEVDRNHTRKEQVEYYNLFSLIWYYIRIIWNLIKRKFRVGSFNWKIVFKDSQNIKKFITQPSNSFWADPFVVKHNNKIYVFIEELDSQTKLGHISLLELNNQYDLIGKKVILKEKYHLSFPNVFLLKNEFYMIPESSQNNKLSLYRSDCFPDTWEYKMDLFEDIKLVDATWIYHDDLYWIFANKIEGFENDNNEKLYLYYSDDLFSKDWKSHPENPIVTNASNARNAGKIYQEKDKLIRPSQNCLKSYGGGITLNEILELNTRNYKEKKVSEICPDEGYYGIHTINSEEGLCVYDYLKLE